MIGRVANDQWVVMDSYVQNPSFCCGFSEFLKKWGKK